jgi:homogentisate 1,2-dioxygenase
MGLIRGGYDAKKEGFMPGGASLHSCMTPHGPDATTFEEASHAELKPQRYSNDSLAFMFESSYLFKVTPWANTHKVQLDYYKCWQDLKSHFNPNEK